jgi:hypothetical protein
MAYTAALKVAGPARAMWVRLPPRAPIHGGRRSKVAGPARRPDHREWAPHIRVNQKKCGPAHKAIGLARPLWVGSLHTRPIMKVRLNLIQIRLGPITNWENLEER